MRNLSSRTPSSLRSLSESKGFVRAIGAIVVLLVLVAVYEVGVTVGYHEARSSYRWGENYARNFGGPPEGFIPHAPALPDGHGAFGEVSSISLPTFIIIDPRHPEERIRIGDDTIIKNLNITVSAEMLKSGMRVVVLGEPNESGEIEAKLIRIVPTPPVPSGSLNMASTTIRP